MILLGLAACQPISLATPPPTPNLLQVQMVSGLTPWRENLHTCNDQISQIGLVVYEIPEGSADLSQVDLFLRLGEPENFEGSAVLLGYEPLVVIVHPDNPHLRIQTSDLQAIYQGDLSDWSDVKPQNGSTEKVQESQMNIWTFPENDTIRYGFGTNLLAESSEFTEGNVAPSAQAMLEAIAADPGAIGYLPSSWLNDTVKALEPEAELSERLRLPVLGLTHSEPQGLVRELLSCLQDQNKEK